MPLSYNKKSLSRISILTNDGDDKAPGLIDLIFSGIIMLSILVLDKELPPNVFVSS